METVREPTIGREKATSNYFGTAQALFSDLWQVCKCRIYGHDNLKEMIALSRLFRLLMDLLLSILLK